jgi:hypothetical protein
MLQGRLREEDDADFHDREKQEKEDRRDQREFYERIAGTRIRAPAAYQRPQTAFCLSSNVGHNRFPANSAPSA